MTDWGALRSYVCGYCTMRCINEIGSDAEANGVCNSCLPNVPATDRAAAEADAR